MPAPPLPLSAIRLPAFQYDASGRVVAANASAGTLAGRSLAGASPEEVVRALRLRSPDGTPLAAPGVPISRVLAGGEAIDVPLTVTAADGRIVYVLATASPIREGDAIAGVLVVWQDVTRQRETETALRGNAERARERDLRLNLALEVAAVGTFDWDLVTHEETWDDRIRAQWGLSPGVPVTHEVWESAIHPDDRAAVAAANERALDPAGDGRYAAEYRVIGHSDGVERWITARGQVFVEDGRPVRMIGATIDLTERKRAELELARSADDLRASQDQLRDVIAATGAGYFHLSLDADKGTVSRRGAEILGFPADQMPSLLGIVAEAQTRVHPDDVAGLLDSFLTFIGADTERSVMEFRVRTPEGGWRWVQAIGTSAERDETGRVTALAGFLFDIDERRRAEEALRRSNEELQRFAYVASHDLQEPLRSIVSFSQLLERRYRGELGAEADEYIEFIVDGGVRMQRLIHDLLQVARIQTEARPFAPTDPAGVVADVLQAHRGAIEATGATVEVGELPTVLADRGQFDQVLSNLVGNALKYRREGVPPRIAITAHRVGPMVEFGVQDNGIGIEEQYFDRIFEMFRRLHTRDQYEGTGIGLAVVKRIVERHGGRVRVESTPGEGSTFFFTLPAA